MDAGFRREMKDILKIKEIIVVEGKDDERAIKQAVDAEVIITSGFQISKSVFERIAVAQQKKGVIIFTDPDHPGEQIRKRINDRIKGCKNAYLLQKDARKKNDIGIENATPESIVSALKKAKCRIETSPEVFSHIDLFAFNLSAGETATKRREMLGKILGIGYANTKQLVKRLNTYGISREQFESAMEEIDKRTGEDA